MALVQTGAALLVFLNLCWFCYAGNFRERLFRNGPCDSQQFRCLNDECIERNKFCNGVYNCTDRSDESHCNTGNLCPKEYPFYRCREDYRNAKCIPKKWTCDGIKDCYLGDDEQNCTYTPDRNLENIHLPKQAALKWLSTVPKNNTTLKWGPQVHRIAVALHLAGANISTSVKSELAYETSIQLLSRLALKKIESISSSEIAHFINAFLVTCIDPRKFHVVDLVAELRKRVNAENYTNPYVMLSLCNAGVRMVKKDDEKLKAAFSADYAEFWTDTQAYAIMALVCSASQPNSDVDRRDIYGMTLMLKNKQFKNGTVENLKTTALVMQALFAAETEEDGDNLDEEKAMKHILMAQKKDGSFGSLVNTYYVLPVLNYRSFVNISSKHCVPPELDEEKGLKDLLNQVGPKWRIQYSLWIGDQKDVQRVLKLSIPANTSMYGLMEMAAEVDSKFKFQYNVKNGKPYIYAISGIQDDPESGFFWFPFFEQVDASSNKITPITESPADIIPGNNQLIIYWYKSGSWN